MIFFHNSDFDHPERKGHGAKVSGSESSREQNGQGTKGPGSEMARERVDQGANRPECYWLIRSGERIGPAAKRLGTVFLCIVLAVDRRSIVKGDENC